MILSPLCSNRSTSSECHSSWWWYAHIDFDPTTAKTRLHDIWSLPQPLQFAQSKLWNLTHYSFFLKFSSFKPSLLKFGLFQQIVSRSKPSFLWFLIVILCLSYYRNVTIRADELTRWISRMTKLVAMSSRPKPTFWKTASTLLLSVKWVPLYPMVCASVVCTSQYTFVMEINKWCEIFFLFIINWNNPALVSSGVNVDPYRILTIAAVFMSIILSVCIILLCYCFRKYIFFLS